MGNINGVPVNKGQFGVIINLQFSRREHIITNDLNFAEIGKLFLWFFKGFVLK